ncbi:hypothetical protein PIB30_062492 [Stylosanthes scabra]|uniref:Aminotransferase-like plant mobile domain-containing protein n=1 Tax=Stylosanthes scabra TaxID=79078 RepID=A0ABU6SMB7_9FABA|nr:hypothetical protein [Stylosanthes scabra]
MVFVRWLPLLEDFEQCKKLSWGSVVLCYTYHCLCQASDRATTDIAGCLPLMMSRIYQRFPRWCPDARSAIVFLLASRLNGLRQQSRDTYETRMVATRLALDRLGVHEIACTPYDNPAWDALRPTWMLTDEEQRTWRAVVPIVCFMYVRMHHVNG